MPDGPGAVVLIDEFSLRRAALKALLDLWMDPDDIEIIDFDMPRATVHLEVEPDAQLLLLNVGGGSLEDASNRHTLRLLRSVAPEAPLAILGERDSPEEIQIAIRLGAKAFLPASLDPKFVKNCLEFLISGGSFFPTWALIAAAEEADDGPEDESSRLAAMSRRLSEPQRGRSRARKSDRSPKRDAGPKKAQAEAMTGATLFRRQEPAEEPAVAPPEVDNGAAAPLRACEIAPLAGRAPAREREPAGPEERREPPRAVAGAGPIAGQASGYGQVSGQASGQAAGPVPGAVAAPVSDLITSLTPRQREVLELLAKGASNKEIARKLSTTEPTVKIHVRQIIKRFGVSNRTQVVVSMFERKDELAAAATLAAAQAGARPSAASR